MIPGARPAWDAVRAAIALERFPVSRDTGTLDTGALDTGALDTGTRSQNIVVIGSGHLLSILAENDLLRAENTRLRATIECSSAPVSRDTGTLATVSRSAAEHNCPPPRGGDSAVCAKFALTESHCPHTRGGAC